MSGSSRGQVLTPIARLIGGGPGGPCSGMRWTENMKVLFKTALLFTTITVVQAVAAGYARSEALMADCVAMGVDALTHFLNVIVESREGKRLHAEMKLAVPAVCLTVLIYFSMIVLHEARDTLAADVGGDDEDAVNPHIIIAFSLLGMVFGGVALRAFMKDAEFEQGSNMTVALVQVLADFARCITTLVAAMLMLQFGLDGARTDAQACVIVSVLVFGGVGMAVWEWVKDLREYFRI
jgi:Co/Zn/Cd efflux system component